MENIMTNFPLIKFEGKALEKLVETVSNGIGTLYKPVAIRKEAKAKAFELLITERAKSQAIQEKNQKKYEGIKRIEKRLWGREKKRQENIDKTVLIAANELKDMHDISDEPVDIDWATKFFNIVEDISNEELITIWAKILAGEIKQPKSFSIRTLERLKELSKDEALIFNKICQYALKSDDVYFIFYPDNGEFLNQFGITFTDILIMQETGLLKSTPNLKMDFHDPHKGSLNAIIYNRKALVLNRINFTGTIKIHCLVFTIPGSQLLKLTERNIDDNYINSIRDYFKNKSIDIDIEEIVEKDGIEVIRYNNNQPPTGDER